MVVGLKIELTFSSALATSKMILASKVVILNYVPYDKRLKE
jgi:hypothetical protein